MSSERVFILGGTGNIGAKAVNDLLENKVPVTLYARNPVKVSSMFPHGGDLVKTIQGDYSDLSPIKEGVKGHTRLLLIVNDFQHFEEIKATVAKYAYEAGVKQIVDLSSLSVSYGWRDSLTGSHHYYAEKAIFEMPNRGYFVALRPTRFMSNLFELQRPLADGALYDTTEPDAGQDWVSPNDIGAVAAVVLREDIHKHADAVYNLVSDVVTGVQRAQVLSRVSGKEIPYVKLSGAERYRKLMESGLVPHLLAINLCDSLDSHPCAPVTPSIEILLGRKPETLESYISTCKDKLL